MPPLISPYHPNAPKYWLYEETGQLRKAVEAYLLNCSPLTLKQIGLLRSYFEQWINSPVWKETPEIKELRETVKTIVFRAHILAWLELAAIAGVDPL